MITTGDLKKGLTIEMDGELYRIVDWQHIKLARGSAQVRMKLRNLRSGATITHTCQAGSRFARARLDRAHVQYLYHEGDLYTFMNVETYEQPVLQADLLNGAKLLGWDGEIGQLKAGYYADIIAVRGDLLRHIDRLQDVQIVICRGLRYR